MRVLFVTPYVPLSHKPRPYQFITRLAQRHEVDLIAQDAPARLAAAAGRPELATLRAVCGDVQLIAQPRRRSYVNCAAALANGEPLRVAYCRSPTLDAAVSSALAHGGYDVLHVDRERLAPLGRTASGTGVRRVLDYVDAHGAYNRAAARFERRPDRRLVLRIEAERMERFEAAVRSDFEAAIITSAADRRELGGGGVPDVDVVPMGVDLDEFAPAATRQRADRLVFVGGMYYFPNIDAARFLARTVLPEVRRRRPTATLALVGTNPDRSVRRLAGPSVEVTGWVPDVRPHVAEAALFVAPLRVGGGFPIKLSEAMAMGKAILASHEVAAGLDAEPGVHLEVASRADFPAVAAALLADGDRRAELGAAARRYAETHLDWRPVIDRLLRSYGDPAAIEKSALEGGG